MKYLLVLVSGLYSTFWNRQGTQALAKQKMREGINLDSTLHSCQTQRTTRKRVLYDEK